MEKYLILHPAYEENGARKESKTGDINAVTQITDVGSGLKKVTRLWKNESGQPRKIQTLFETETAYRVSHYVIPCVSYNGNEWGNGKEPKGLLKNGEAWYFSYDREGIPSCTLCENSETVTAVFASPYCPVSSCSLALIDGGRMRQTILRPLREAPFTYSSRDGYSQRKDEYIYLEPGQETVDESYIYTGIPEWENFGFSGLSDAFIDNFDVKTKPDLAADEIWKRGIAFAKSLITDCRGKKGFIIGHTADSGNGFVYRGDECFELGWCGQNAAFARMLMTDGIKNKKPEELTEGMEILDGWAENACAESGLIVAQLRDTLDVESASADTCNMGWGAAEMVRAYRYLRANGIERPSYLNAAKGAGRFFVENYSEQYGFGKQWTMKGECTDRGGTVGAFVICALTELFSECGDKEYLETAEKAFKLYSERDLDKFMCTAGALDTTCVDKETSVPLLISAVRLYEITRKPVYLEYGRKAGYYFCSWMYHYNAVYPENSDFMLLGYTTLGGTAVSAQHHHLDPFGALIVPELLSLSKLTGDKRWAVRAKMIWDNTTKCISGENTAIHGRLRPYGSQNEGFFQCDWNNEGAARGSVNDWLVAWPSAFRLLTLERIEDPDSEHKI